MSTSIAQFRPAYLRLHGLIKTVLRPRCVLALTATATPSVVEALGRAFEIPAGGVWQSSWRRPNLHFSCSAEDDRQRALLGLLRAMQSQGLPRPERATTTASKPPAPSSDQLQTRSWGAGIPPTIVYVASQADADSVGNYLSSSGITAAAYHAGLGLLQRDRVYARFMAGGLDVVVAVRSVHSDQLYPHRGTFSPPLLMQTTAFGMGIDKNNVRCVVHYSLPRSLEEYVQQCGRAGRDGIQAHCHAFLDRSGEDVRRLHSLVSSDVVDISQVWLCVCAASRLISIVPSLPC